MRWWHSPSARSALAAPLAVAVLLLTVVFGGGTTLLQPTAVAAAQGQSKVHFERSVVKVTNRTRARHDRARLRRQACLDRFAQRQARRLARIHRLEHQPLDPILDECGLWSVGENLAMGYVDARGAVRGWMGSPDHRANVLRPTFRLIGVGAAQDHQGIWWVAQVFGRR
ncbi:CAP domain-containing protein [Nocardioides sp. YIM 152588]|uniref:CAP domain-containing protein n=1 Tax=Nocardioides sp. YIM 152588 TaxID=3158259 RepID=UPI0032E51C0E